MLKLVWISYCSIFKVKIHLFIKYIDPLQSCWLHPNFCNVTLCNVTPSHSWLLPCGCVLLLCKCLAKVCSNILCILSATTPTGKPPFIPKYPNPKVQILEFTYCNDRFPMAAVARKHDKYTMLQPLLIHTSMGSTTTNHHYNKNWRNNSYPTHRIPQRVQH